MFRFSLATMLKIVSLACVLAALAFYFPEPALEVIIRFCIALPSILVVLALGCFARKRRRLVISAVVGATLAWIIAPRLLVNPTPSAAERLISDGVVLAPFIAAGAFLFGVCSILANRKRRRIPGRASTKWQGGPRFTKQE